MTFWNVGAAGLIDDRIWPQLAGWQACPVIKIAAASDSSTPLLNRAHDTLGVPRLYSSWQEMLWREDIQILHVGLEPANRVELVETAASRGIHVMMDGPMAASLDQAERMLSAARSHGTKLFVSWPTAFNPAAVHAAQLARDEAIGPVIQVSSRVAHGGPASGRWSPLHAEWTQDAREAGAGAIMEGCSQGVQLCRVIIGLPSSCTAVAEKLAGGAAGVDDTAVIVLRYTAALGIAEASWLQPYEETLPEIVIRCRAGSLLVTGQSLHLARQETPAPIAIPVPPLQEGAETAAEAFLSFLLRDLEIDEFCNPQVARDTQEILEAGILSAETGRVVRLPLR